MLRRFSVHIPRPSFLEGFARLFDWAGTLDNYDDLFSDDADARALRSDWDAVGNDIRSAINSEKERLSI